MTVPPSLGRIEAQHRKNTALHTEAMGVNRDEMIEVAEEAEEAEEAGEAEVDMAGEMKGLTEIMAGARGAVEVVTGDISASGSHCCTILK